MKQFALHVQVVMGDHGNRVFPGAQTQTGRIEERRPFLAIYLPDWWRRKNGDKIDALVHNRHRLTSNFDVHRMLMDIVYGYRDDEYQPPGKIKGRSGKTWNNAS
jgi:hypothetical protein